MLALSKYNDPSVADGLGIGKRGASGNPADIDAAFVTSTALGAPDPAALSVVVPSLVHVNRTVFAIAVRDLGGVNRLYAMFVLGSKL